MTALAAAPGFVAIAGGVQVGRSDVNNPDVYDVRPEFRLPLRPSATGLLADLEFTEPLSYTTITAAWIALYNEGGQLQWFTRIEALDGSSGGGEGRCAIIDVDIDPGSADGSRPAAVYATGVCNGNVHVFSAPGSDANAAKTVLTAINGAASRAVAFLANFAASDGEPIHERLPLSRSNVSF